MLLVYAKLRPVSNPISRADLAVLSVLREAHERYPFYEHENLDRIVRQLSASKELYDMTLLPEYEARLHSAGQRAAYYEKAVRTEDERLFEARYTSYSDRGVMDYVRDVLALLCAEELLAEAEAMPLLALIQRTEAGMSIWSMK